ncbi:putative phage tail protein [Pantoea dispersa]|uniref:TipJ family phage tail tip protein n=1 Tax=Pantoea dispersa TaxID=59814 RepID=UPI003D1A50C8
MATATVYKGRKGGSSSSRTPTEQPDDLQSVAKAKILLALGEGEFFGGLTAKQIYLDGTAIENADGSQNFSGVAWEFRSGTQAQSYIQGIPGTENEISVGTDVTSTTAWIHTFTNTQLSAIRLRLKWPALFKQEDDGDLVGYSINYAVDLQTDGGTWTTVINTAVTGKTTTGYERSHRIDLPQAGSTWTVRVRKLTAESNSAKIGDTMTLQSYTEVIDAKLRYPNTALLYIEFDSSQFNGSIPQITCEPKGRVIRVPDNYDPNTRSYSGTWLGTFKWAWTDNPAWIFYDIVVSDRFGLGDRLTAANIDKWTLYQVAQYCDQMVPDGKGGSGTEPRYKCDVYVQTRNDAYTVMRDFAAIFRGMTYWGGDQIVALADMPRDVDYNFTNANVVDGEFAYSSSTTKTRYTSALVSYSDPDNGYADAMEPVFEKDLVSRYKVYNQLEVTAIGCTRQSEANRKGRWGILTNNKDRVVAFSVGLDGDIPMPGYVIAVADEYLSGRVAGGRISSVNGRVLTLDRAPDAKAGDRLQVNLPSGISQARTVQAVTGNIVTVTTAYTQVPEAESVWVVESTELYAQQYRVTSVAENEDGTFTITAAAHDPDKYARIDTGVVIDQRPISVIPPGNQAAPNNIVIDSYSAIQQGMSVETMRVHWDSTPNALSYDAQWRRNDGNWISVPRSSTTSFEVPGIYAGRYLVRVRAINAAEISSGWGYSQEKTLTGKVGKAGVPTGLSATTDVAWAINVTWGFPPASGDTSYTEIEFSATADGSNPQFLAYVPYPAVSYQHGPMPAGVRRWYRARLVDKIGNTGDWTNFVAGASNTDANELIQDTLEKYLQTPDGKALLAPLITDPQLLAETILASYDDVDQQWKNYGNNRTGIIEARKIAVDATSAIAETEKDVAAKFEEQEAVIQEKFTAYADASGPSAIWTMKMGLNYNGTKYDAGISVAAIVNGTQVETRFAVNANQFVVLSGSGNTLYSPFIIRDGQVLINQAFIGKAWITNAMIGDYIESTGYVTGQTGWHINKNGTAEFSGVTVRGKIYASEGELNNVTINENCTIKGTLSANRINGPLMQTALYFFNQFNTNATNTVYWDGTAGRGDVPMTLYILATRDVNNTQGAAGVWVDGVRQNPAGQDNSNFPGTKYVIQKNVGTGGCRMEFRAGALNQGQSEYSRWTVQVFAAPTANQFHT